MKNWEPNDRPWVEHARWYQNCAFLKQCKSEKFINDVINNGISTPNQANNSLQVLLNTFSILYKTSLSYAVISGVQKMKYPRINLVLINKHI